jgi:hypothetical protein
VPLVTVDLRAEDLGAVDEALASFAFSGAHWDPMLVPTALSLDDDDLIALTFGSPLSRQRALDRNQAAVMRLREVGVDVRQRFSSDKAAAATVVNSQRPMARGLRFADLPLADVLHIRCLVATRVAISDADSVALGKMQTLKVLCLTSRLLTDVGLTHLQNLNELERLDLTAENVSPKGVVDLVDKLPKLRDLGLHASLIGMRVSDVKELRTRHPGLHLRLR